MRQLVLLFLVSSALPIAAAAPLSRSAGQAELSVTFDDLPQPNRVLAGEYPTSVIDWGSDGWYLSAPWGVFRTNSISFNGPLPSSASFTLLSPRRLVQVDAYNGGPDVSDIELSCDQVSLVQLQLGARQLTTIVTGRADACTTV